MYLYWVSLRRVNRKCLDKARKSMWLRATTTTTTHHQASLSSHFRHSDLLLTIYINWIFLYVAFFFSSLFSLNYIESHFVSLRCNDFILWLNYCSLKKGVREMYVLVCGGRFRGFSLLNGQTGQLCQQAKKSQYLALILLSCI
jgi:hypothetical protein